MQSEMTAETPTRKRLGELLVAQRIVTSAQVEEALALQRDEYDFLGQILLRLGYIDEAQLQAGLTQQYLENYRKRPSGPGIQDG